MCRGTDKPISLPILDATFAPMHSNLPMCCLSTQLAPSKMMDAEDLQLKYKSMKVCGICGDKALGECIEH